MKSEKLFKSHKQKYILQTFVFVWQTTFFKTKLQQSIVKIIEI